MPNIWAPPGAASLVVTTRSEGGSGEECIIDRAGRSFCKSGCCCAALLDIELAGGGTDTVCVPPGTDGSYPCTLSSFIPSFGGDNPSLSADSPWTTWWAMDLTSLPPHAEIVCIILDYVSTTHPGQGNITRLYDFGGEGGMIVNFPNENFWQVTWGVDAIRQVRAAVAQGSLVFPFWMTVEFFLPPACTLRAPANRDFVICRTDLD